MNQLNTSGIMKILIASLTTLFLFSQCKTVDDTIETIIVEEVESESLKDLEGHWKFLNAEKVRDIPFLRDFPIQATPAFETADMETPYKGPDLIFEDDTLHEVLYPIHRYKHTQYSTAGGYLYCHEQWHKDSFPMQKRGDTLFIYRPFYEDVYIQESFVRTRFDDSLVFILKIHGSNYPKLAGSWLLVRQSSGNDGTEYTLDFPYSIPDTLRISREEFVLGVGNNYTYWMRTDGLKKEYAFVYKWGALRLTPGTWYKGEDPWIHFERVEEGE